jgi:hypothetical protein
MKQRTSDRGGELYAAWADGATQCEFDQLLTDAQRGPYSKQFLLLGAEITEMASKTGFLPYLFRDEPGFEMFPRRTSEARICTLRFSSKTLILGGGGIKRKGTAAYQDCPGLYEAVKFMQSISSALTQYLESTGSSEDPSGGFVDRWGLPLEFVPLTHIN